MILMSFLYTTIIHNLNAIESFQEVLGHTIGPKCILYLCTGNCVLIECQLRVEIILNFTPCYFNKNIQIHRPKIKNKKYYFFTSLIKFCAV